MTNKGLEKLPKQNREEDWYDKLLDLIEEEIVLATGVKGEEHFSGDCRINDIMELVRNLLIQEFRKGYNQRLKDEKHQGKYL